MAAVSTPARAFALVLPLCAAFGLASAAGWGSVPNASVAQPAGIGLAFGTAAVSCLLHAARHNDPQRPAWALFGLAAAMSTLGNAVLVWEQVTGRADPVEPSLADALLLLAAPFGVAGLVAFTRLPRRFLAWASMLLDGWLVAGSLFTLGWNLLLARLPATDAHTPRQVFFVVAYPVLDVLVITVLLSLRSRTPREHRAGLTVLIGALAAAMASDLLWLIPRMWGSGVPAGLLSAGWFAAGLLIAVAPWTGGGAGIGSRPPKSISLIRAFAPYLAAGLSAVAVIGYALSGQPLDPVVLVVGGTVVTAAVIRQAATLADNVALTRELAAREDHFRSLVQGSSDVMLVTSVDGVVRYVSPAIHRVYGWNAEEVLGGGLRLYVHPEDFPAFERVIFDFLATSRPSARIECRIRTADGGWRHTESTVSRHPEGLIFNSRDVTDRVALQERLTYQAFHDTLTGLPNRALLARQIESALSARDGERVPAIAVLFLDLDGFKAVNDSFGHATGDDILVQAARRLREAITPGEPAQEPADLVARFGGDEFAALLGSAASPEATRAVAERLLLALAEPYQVGDIEVAIAASIGVAFSGPGVTAEDLMRNADLAMYRAKAAGKGRVEVYRPQMRLDLLRRMELESRVRAVG